MNFWMKLCLLLFCGILLLTLFGCYQQPPEETTVMTTAQTGPTMSTVEKYLLGCSSIKSAHNWKLNYVSEEKRTVGLESYDRIVSGTASYSKLLGSDMEAVVEEQLSYGMYHSAYLEVYCDENTYVQVNGSNFKQKMTPEAFLERQIPAILLDSSLYQTVTETVSEDSTIIDFSNPTAMEKWAAVSKAQLVSANGRAVLDSVGVLKESNYHAVYLLGETQYEIKVHMQVTAPQTLDLSSIHQEHLKDSEEISNVDVPKVLLQVVGDIYAGNTIQCNAKESIYSQAIPVLYSQKSKYHLTGAEEKLNAYAEYQVSITDYRGDASSNTWMESFVDGKYTTTRENVTDTAVTGQQMRQYLEDAILSALAAPIYLENADIQEKDTLYRMELTGNERFVTDMVKNIASFLQVDLGSKATETKTISAGGYLTIDKKTGLPLSMGLYLEQEYTMDSGIYQLTYQMDQSMTLSETE